MDAKAFPEVLLHRMDALVTVFAWDANGIMVWA